MSISKLLAILSLSVLVQPAGLQERESQPPPKITSIELKSWSYWSSRHGPHAWKVTFARDGSARFSGTQYWSRRVGEFTGTISPEDYQRLEEYIREIRFDSLATKYNPPGSVADATHIVTTVHYEDRSHSVDNYYDSGPREVWILEMALKGLTEEKIWQLEDESLAELARAVVGQSFESLGQEPIYLSLRMKDPPNGALGSLGEGAPEIRPRSKYDDSSAYRLDLDIRHEGVVARIRAFTQLADDIRNTFVLAYELEDGRWVEIGSRLSPASR